MKALGQIIVIPIFKFPNASADESLSFPYPRADVPRSIGQHMTIPQSPSASNLESEHRFALLIAVEWFADPALRDLSATLEDTSRLATLLQDPTIGGYEVTMLYNKNSGEVNMKIEQFFGERSIHDFALVYISTHGILDSHGRLFFAMSDTKPDRLASTALASNFIRDAMDRSRAKRQVLLLDASFSGAFMRGTK